MKTNKIPTGLRNISTKIIIILVLTLIFIFEADTYRLINADPEREKVWRIMLSLFSILIICVSTYMMNLRLTKKINNAYIVAVVCSFFGGIISIGSAYLGYQGLVLSLFFVLRSIFIGYLFALVYDWRRKALKEKELLHSELSFLKNQINPHFLFNTLNNIDSLIRSKPEKASETLVELSDMMRYMIYETNVEMVTLKQELQYIENYLKLQRLQYSNRDLVNYKVTGTPDNIRIAPMLFISFIENAFKHCTNKDEKEAIQLSFDINDKSITFSSTNISNKGYLISKDKSSGIGLDNVKRRLELTYPQKHKLEIKEKNDLYCVTLIIEPND